MLDYSDDLKFWAIDQIWLEQCCEGKYSIRKFHIRETVSKERAYQEAVADPGDDPALVFAQTSLVVRITESWRVNQSNSNNSSSLQYPDLTCKVSRA